MAATLILSHGGLASELLAAARTIVGELPGFAALSLDWEDSFEAARAKTAAALAALDSSRGVLILTDIYGGTPFNVAASLRDAGRVEVLAGVNLPMVVRLACGGLATASVAELAEWIVEKSRGGICRAQAEAGEATPPGGEPERGRA
ncbi:MAG: PTS sugar transporter subunit IIA [Thermoanaerobaculia bacterium]